MKILINKERGARHPFRPILSPTGDTAILDGLLVTGRFHRLNEIAAESFRTSYRLILTIRVQAMDDYSIVSTAMLTGFDTLYDKGPTRFWTSYNAMNSYFLVEEDDHLRNLLKATSVEPDPDNLGNGYYPECTELADCLEQFISTAIITLGQKTEMILCLSAPPVRLVPRDSGLCFSQVPKWELTEVSESVFRQRTARCETRYFARIR